MSKIAIVHDYLTQTGGAERLALTLSNIFPDAPIFTSIYEPNTTLAEFADRDVRTSFLQNKVPAKHFRLAAPLYAPAFASFDLREFDKVVISTSGFAHHVNHPNAFVYCHTPPHFLYELDAYMAKGIKRSVISSLVPTLRIADKRAARRHNNYVANSVETAQKISANYGKSVPVIHPPFSTTHLPTTLPPLPESARCLMVGRLMPYKRFDLAIEACHLAGTPLTIVGSGPDEQRLRALAGRLGSFTTFTGRISDRELAEIWSWHSLALMPGVEDFGFAPLDANYSGRPIIGRDAGGAIETIAHEVTGLRVGGENPDDWAQAIRFCLARPWDPSELRASTSAFQFDAFRNRVLDWVGEPILV